MQVLGRAVPTPAIPKELFVNLTLRELRGKYKRSTLGWLWSVANPVVSLAIYSVVFGVFLQVPPPEGRPSGLEVYAFFLVCGLLPWTFLANGLMGSVSSLVDNAGLIKKVYFPRSVLPTSTVASWSASFATELAVLAVALLVVGNMVLPWLPVVILVMALQFAFVLGLGLAASAANAYFRDVEHFLSIALNVWFYATPVLYPVSLVPERRTVLGFDVPVRDLLALNPMNAFVEAYRDLLYHLRAPALGEWAYLVAAAAVTLAVGALVFRRLEPRLAEEL